MGQLTVISHTVNFTMLVAGIVFTTVLIGHAKEGTTPVITKAGALEIAEKTLKKSALHSKNVTFVLEKTVEKDFGWVFFYAPKQHPNPVDHLPGNGSLVVHRADGTVKFLNLGVYPEKAIEAYEKEWRKQGKTD